MVHHNKKRNGIILTLTLIASLASCGKADPDNFEYGIILPNNFQVEYTYHNGYIDTGKYIRVGNAAYVKHQRDTGGSAEFYVIEQTDVGYNDGQNNIQDYITFRLIGTQWVRASNWSDNLNYFTMLGSSSWSPYQSGTVYGPFHYLTEGVAMLNNKAVTYTKQNDETLSIDGGLFSCLVYTLTENYTYQNQPKVATTKLWIDKETFMLFKKSYTTDAQEDINGASAVEFEMTKYAYGSAISFPNGVPQSTNG